MRLSHHLSCIRTGQMPSNIQSSLVSYSDRFVTFFITRTIQINIIISIPFMEFLFYFIFLTTKMPDSPNLWPNPQPIEEGKHLFYRQLPHFRKLLTYFSNSPVRREIHSFCRVHIDLSFFKHSKNFKISPQNCKEKLQLYCQNELVSSQT